MLSAPGDDQEAGLVRIGEFARLSGTSPRTLRYYESLGLLRPAARSPGRFRYYRVRDVHRLRMIQSLQELGLGLDQMGELLSARPEDLPREEFIERVRNALLREQELLAARTRQLAERRRKVERALAKLHDCTDCELIPCRENNFCDPCPVDGKPLPADLGGLF